MSKEREPNQDTGFEDQLREVFGDNPVIPYMVQFVSKLSNNLGNEEVIRSASKAGAFIMRDILETGNSPIVEMMNRVLFVDMTAQRSPGFISRLGNPGIEDLISAALAENTAQLLTGKNRGFEIRGSFEKLRRLGVPPGYFSPQRIAKEINAKYKLLNDSNTRANRVLGMIMEGPNVDLEAGLLPNNILRYAEQTLGEILSLDSASTGGVQADLHTFPLVDVTQPSDPRKSFLLRIRADSDFGKKPVNSGMSLSFNWTDQRGDGSYHAYDGRNPGYYYLEQFRSEISPDASGRLKTRALPLPEDCPEGTIYFFSDNLVSQSFSHITRFILDQCAFGDKILLRNNNTDQVTPITMDKLLEGIDMWDEEFPGIPDDFRDFYNEIPKKWDEFKFDSFRGDEYISRLVVAYGLDPFRFVAATHATGLLPHLKLHGYISEHGGIDMWVRKIAKTWGIEFEKDTATDKILNQLSTLYRSKREQMQPEEYSWFTSKYIDPSNEYQLEWSDSIDLVTPWFMDRCAREPDEDLSFYLRPNNVRIVGD